MRLLRLLGALLVASTALGGIAIAASAPSASTGGASSVQGSSAVLHGQVNPHGASTSYQFEWGTTTSYGASSPSTSAGNGTFNVAVQQSISGLTPGTTYHYRIVATNQYGTSDGSDHTFRTQPVRPGAATAGASSVQGSSAVLHGQVNPHGASTSYQFEWGTTTSYGASSPSTSAGNGTFNVDVQQSIGGLTPSTTYHYRIVATNGSGTSDGSDHTFKTLAVPAEVTTGGATGLSAYDATVTGTVNPNNQRTGYFFQWGTLSSLSHRTKAQSFGPSIAPQSVSATLPMLQPGTVYQYRLVATHANSVRTYGATELLMTYPLVRPYASITAKVRPRHRYLYPYVFTTTGTVAGPYWIPAQFACIGEVTIRFYHHSQQVRFETTPIQSDCTYAAKTVFNRLPGGVQSPPERLRVVVHFVSTPYLARSRAPIRHVHIG